MFGFSREPGSHPYPGPTPAPPQPVTMVLHGFPGMRKKGVVGAEVLDSLWLLV